MVGSTPVTWMSKCQGAVATSTYSAELCAMRLATEEAITICIPVNEPKLFGDNLEVIQNASMPEATLQKKHTVAAKIIEKITLLTSPSQFMVLCSSIMHGI